AAGPATVPVDIDPGFPVVIDWRITATNDLGQVAVSRLYIGPVYANGGAPAAPDGGPTCADGPSDAVIPFYRSVIPSTIGVGTVALAFSQGAPGIADTARFPMTVEFNEVGGHRCTSATSSDPVTTPAQAVFTNIADGEVGGGYGYLVVPAYFDAAGMPLGATSAVLVVTPSINGRATDNVFTVYGVVPVEYVDPVSGRTFGAVPLAP
ncbi:MAG: hypothetical protein ABW195_08340, partial [Ilumatobacteraceae bacterium]